MPTTNFKVKEKYSYLNGFGSHLESEAIKGALPVGANSPQKCSYGLYAEKLSGTSFTAPRHENLQSWLYRILPSASHERFAPYDASTTSGSASAEGTGVWNFIPDQLRWDPFDLDGDADWIGGMQLAGGAGNPVMKQGLGIHIFAVTKDMSTHSAFYSADGDLLIVAQHGSLDIQTELGHLLVRPNEIAVIPRGIRHRVTLPDGPARGYILELYQGHFTLPELGPIGSNGLANARDFQAPVASFVEDTNSATPFKIIARFNRRLFVAEQNHTPFDVVAWHGRYYPYKYDLGRFNTIGSVSFDHPDPSIFTVLTAPSPAHGAGHAVCDFVVFPPRWLVQENTFRPPWYHRNVMAEFMGLISGDYDAKEGGGFRPGGASLHNCMSGHGPDMASFEKASNAELKPGKVGDGSMAFMFESCLMLGVTDWGLKTCQKVQDDYNAHSWTPLKVHFKHPEKE